MSLQSISDYAAFGKIAGNRCRPADGKIKVVIGIADGIRVTGNLCAKLRRGGELAGDIIEQILEFGLYLDAIEMKKDLMGTLLFVGGLFIPGRALAMLANGGRCA